MRPQQTISSDKVETTFATENDLPQLVELLSELFSIEKDFIPNREKQLQGLRLILNFPDLGRLFVMRVGEKPVGMANALITASTAEGDLVLLLEDVILSREYRGRGLGRRLVEHVLKWARENGLARVTLMTDQDNQAALDFYHKLGFELSNMKVLRKKM